jgi:ATP-dependent exoDNAse (exonuclease V) beta subunit
MPQFMQKSGSGSRLQGAQRGTAVHKMLQYMDFSAAAEDPEAELHRLQKTGCLTDAEAEALKPEKLSAFFTSDLYQRIAASERVEKEWQFFVEIGDLALPEDSGLHRNYAGTDGILIGTMDLLFREADGWVLVDYKTDYVRKPEELTEELFESYLYSTGVPDPELIIRPSGEMRTSNFLLWQSAYSEFVFMDILWPDFGPADLDRAIEEYYRRNRRFGGA